MCYGDLNYRTLAREAEDRVADWKAVEGGKSHLPGLVGVRGLPALGWRAAAVCGFLILLVLLLPQAGLAQKKDHNDPCKDGPARLDGDWQCLEQSLQAAEWVHAYGTQKGYFDEDGDVDLSAMIDGFLNWRTLVGLPPKDPFLRCLSRGGGGGVEVYDEMWQCIKDFDPEAVELEEI